MSAVPIFTELQVQAWRKKMIKEVISNVLWSSLSNRVDVTSQVPNAGKKKIPDSVVHWVSDSFAKGIQKTTIPFLQKLQDMGQGGWQKVEGEEETPLMRFKTISYNLQRKGLTVSDESVEGDLTEYYAIASQKVQLLTDYFSELTDYNFQRAIMRGADEFLTLQAYWNGQTLTSPPVTESYHPNIFIAGGSGLVTWNATDATYGAAIQAAAKVLAPANTFNLAAMDSMIFQADYSAGVKLQKLGWKSGNNSVQYVGLLSEAQSRQVTTATGSGTWSELMRDAGARGVDNRAISGVLGVYKRTLWLTDERAPLWDCTAATSDVDRVQYYKIEDERVPTVKGATTVETGTCEMARMCGQGAIGAAKIKDLDFVNKDFDYGFSHGLAASQACGAERMDLINTSISAKPLNQSSFLYYTATPASLV
jgi:hypothetical protein